MSNKKQASGTKKVGEPALVPKLRFPEFRGTVGWTEKHLNEIADPVTERAPQGEEDNVLSLSAEYGIVLQSEFFGRKVAGDNSERYLKIARNDFVYNDRTTKTSTFGTIKRLSKHSSGIVSPIYKCFRFHDKENPVFWEWYFESGLHNKALARLVNEGARTGRFNISITQFLSTGAWRPTELEQKKIAECLSSADELIAAQARKVDALKAHKKGLIQQLFPREGETQPRLRFPEFEHAGEWVCEELASCLRKVIDYRGKAPPKSDTGIPLITAKNVRPGWLDMSSDEYIEEDKYEEWMSRGIPQAGDVLFTTEAPLGNVALFPDAGKFAVGQRLLTLQSEPEKCLPEFLFHSLLSPAMQERIDFHSTGSTAKGIKSAVFVKLSFFYPKDLEEQRRIAASLTSLNDLIAAAIQKLEALRRHKRGLMQQLFPSAEEAEA